MRIKLIIVKKLLSDLVGNGYIYRNMYGMKNKIIIVMWVDKVINVLDKLVEECCRILVRIKMYDVIRKKKVYIEIKLLLVEIINFSL